MSDSNDRLLLINESILTDIADAIRTKTGKSQKIYPSNMDEEILSISAGGTTPTGSINITTNGTHDVTNYASAIVNVPTSGTTPTGSINITTNGTHDVTNYSSAVVTVDTESHPPITINITQSDHQTISVSKSMTPVTNNNQVLVPSTVTLKATITPASGYDAGTLNQTQVTAHWGDTVSFSATPATEKSSSGLIFQVNSLENGTSIGSTISFNAYVYAEYGSYISYNNGKYFDIYINGNKYNDDSFYIDEIDGDEYYSEYSAYKSIYVYGSEEISELDIRRGYVLVEIKDRDDNIVVFTEHLEVDSIYKHIYINNVYTDSYWDSAPFSASYNNDGNVTLYNIRAYIDNNLFPYQGVNPIAPSDNSYDLSYYDLSINDYNDLFSTLGSGNHTLYIEASSENNSGVYDVTASYDFYLNPISTDGEIYLTYSNLVAYGTSATIYFNTYSAHNNFDMTSTISFIHPVTHNQTSISFTNETAVCTLNDLPLGDYNITFTYNENKYYESSTYTATFSVTPPVTLNVVQPNDGTITVNGQTGTTFTFAQGSSVEIEAIVNRTDGYTFWEWEESNS